ncbi:hypothetical protein P3T76_011981 [Phytophthora citrophthora]|uniref:Cyclic nucleotide-binding domain-containing protein n=1 Tax=Phytophthora citrophthora TaxID=4793 RepID=A0AAD9G5Y1_9STRA|nr:hypothetical protein P3T76_011981 [Phytophthora citrophthora]
MAAPSSGAIATSGLPASLQPTRVSLLKRGQNREQFLKQKTIVKAAQHYGTRQSQSTRRLSSSAFTRSTRNVLAASDDHLDDLLKGVADSINSPDHLSRSDKEALVLQAVLGLWNCRQEARGFRRWKESTLNRVDLQALMAAGVDVHEEARQLLLTAETKRRLIANERQIPIDDDKWMAANFSYAELDLLLAWARHTQPKTFRGVDDNTLREALRYLRFTQYQDGEAIFFQGDKGDVFYLILDGSVGIYGAKRPDRQKRRQSVLSGKRGSTSNFREKPDMNLMGLRMFTYRAGESFGETALFTNAAERTATAIAFGTPTPGSNTGTVCEVCELSRGVYSRTLKRFHQHFFTQAQCVNFTQRIFLFRDWPRPRVVEVADVLELRRISFGSILLTEGVSPLSHCFFVLSGCVNITTQMETSSPTGNDSTSTSTVKKSRHKTQFSIELHTVRVGEIVALEALLEEDDSPAKVTYTAVGGSADVEVYALKRTDGREFLASSTGNLMHQIQILCNSQRLQRDQRLEIAQRAFRERETTNKRHRLELENEAFELGLTDKQQHHRRKQQELEELNQSSTHEGSISLQRPYLRHLYPAKLLGVVNENNDQREFNQKIEINSCLGEVAAPPKMLSNLVKNFIVRDWDTLAEDYAQKLTLQLPVRNALSPLLKCVPPSLTCRASTPPLTQMHTARRKRTPLTLSARNHAERHTRDSHMRQLSMDYDAKMHWDPEKKNFVLLQTPSDTEDKLQPQQTRVSGALAANDPSRGETTRDQSLHRTKLHYQLQTAQISARKLSEQHTRKQDERSGGTGSSSTFVHFF